MALSTSLVAWWTLNETSGTREDSVGNNDLTDNNTVLYGAGKKGNAADFELATSEYLSIADNADLSTGDIDYSMCCWFKPESVGISQFLMSKWVGAYNTLEYVLYVNTSNQAAFSITDGVDTAATATETTNTLSAGTWYLLVGWHDATANTVNIQVNNNTPVSAADVAGFNSGSAFCLGAQSDGLASYADGLMDEAGFWKKVLSAAERTRLYNGGEGLTYPFSNETLAGSITPTGAVSKKASVSKAGAITFVGAVAKKATHSLAGAITFTGAITKKGKKALAGAITFAGSVAYYKLWILFARFHDYFFTAPQKFTISSNSVQMTARYRDYNFTAPERGGHG